MAPRKDESLSGCTSGSCNPATGCLFTPLCNDQNACTLDTCIGATCFVQDIPCADNNICTYDLCDPVVGCRHPINPKCIVTAPLAVKKAGSTSTIAFKRKGGSGSEGPYVRITLQDVVLTSVNQQLVSQKVKLKAILTDADASIASLLYPVVALGSGAGALDALHAQGCDVAVTGDVPSCQSQLPASACSTLALQLAKAIDGSLALGDGAERDAFRQGAEALGYPPDECVVIP